MASSTWRTLLLSCVVALIVFVGISFSPIRFDLSVGLTPIWLRKHATTPGSAPTQKLPNADLKAAAPTMPRSDHEATDDVLTITIDRGTPMRDGE